jgi:ABC-type polysaccharide/polyol phosphate transport system ATPase subunit
MSNHAIEVEGLGKRYRLGEGRYRYETIREAMSSRLRTRTPADGFARDLWALKDVTLSVDEGDVVGVVGRNGAGKTTLLKLLARITEPTTGVARTRGRVGALLEVGTGFHPELTGRENVYLNGAVLGMSRADITRRFDEIVTFAGVERFLDTPLKRYSSGMHLRLAFAVAAHLEPDIVVVDEVLAVGDAEFQKKCLTKMSAFGRAGRTVLFVSHDLGAIGRLCARAIWLDRGCVMADGATSAVLTQYLASTGAAGNRAEFELDPEKIVQPLYVALGDAPGRATQAAIRSESISLHLRFLARQPIAGFDVAFYILNQQGVQVICENWSDTRQGVGVSLAEGEYDAQLTIPPILPVGDYVLGIWMGTHYDETLLHEEVMKFRVEARPDDRQEWIERPRVVQPPVVWRVHAAPGHAPLIE